MLGILSGMDKERLARYVIDRRTELDLTQTEAAEKGGISLSTWNIVEKVKDSDQSNGTLGAIDRALGWTAGSARRVLEGGDPVVAGEQPADTLVLEAMEEATEVLARLVLTFRRVATQLRGQH